MRAEVLIRRRGSWVWLEAAALRPDLRPPRGRQPLVGVLRQRRSEISNLRVMLAGVGILEGRVTLVTGASRGAGRGIATALGAAGATVYVTGRSGRGSPSVAEFPHSVDETAEEVSAAGGTGIPVICDHTSDDQVRALFERIDSDHGHLDVLVANAWGGYMPYAEHNDWFAQPFWEQSMDRWEGMFTAGLRSHLSTCLFGIPLLQAAGYGLAVLTTFTRGRRYLGNVFYDVSKNAVCRLVAGLAEETRETDLAIVGVSPGWMAVERMTGLAPRQEAEMESTAYIGRAVVALASDPAVSRRSGQTLAVGDLARIYGFTDLDGRQPTPYEIEP